jgi:epoxyqueuosine reductase
LGPCPPPFAPNLACRPPGPDWVALAADIRDWGKALGFQEVGIADTDLDVAERRLVEWLDAGRHGAMDYMARHGVARARPASLVPGTLRVITARMNYRPPAARASDEILATPAKAFIARYALGRDYHKVLRGRLQRLADRIRDSIGDFGYRVFTDSAPVLEVALAAKSGSAGKASTRCC